MADIGVTRTGGREWTGIRLGWGAIIAGFVVATTIQITLATLGIAIGLSTWDVGNPAGDLGRGLGSWLAVSALAALFVGGMTAGRVAGVLTRTEGALHGILVWGIATIVNLWLLMSGAGMVLGGAFNVVGRTASAAVSAAGTGVVRAGEAVTSGGIDASAIEQEIESILRDTRQPALSPDTLRQDVERVREEAVASGADNREVAREIAATLRERGGAVDREAVVNVIVARTELSRPEAERLAERIESAAGGFREEVRAGAEQVQEAAGAATDYAGKAAWWSLLALGLGVAAAAGGGAVTARE